jgi:DNA-binding MarR family transcriptional regulator
MFTMSLALQFEEALVAWERVFVRRSMHEFTRWMTGSGLSRSQLGALMHLHHSGQCAITSLGAELDVSTPAASQLVDRLATSGLVDRIDDPEDRRVKLVVMSDDGKALLQSGLQARQAWLQELGEIVAKEDQAKVAESLNILLDAAEQTKKKMKIKIMMTDRGS